MPNTPKQRTPTTARPKRKHFSMLRTFVLADLITLGNASFGTAVIFTCLNYLANGPVKEHYLWLAFVFPPICVLFDWADGWVARKTKRHSAIGADLDSLSDVISFGVAPAVLGFTLGLRGGYDMAILVFFVACGISRLARYNVTASSMADASGKVKYFEGTPIPMSLIIVGLLLIAYLSGNVGVDGIWGGHYRLGPWGFHPFSIAYFIMGCTMISQTLHIPKL